MSDEPTLGEEIIEGLTELNAVAKTGELLSDHFEVRTVAKPLSNDKLSALEQKLKAVTPGPWTSHEGTVYWGNSRYGLREHVLTHVQHKPEHPAMFCSQDVRDAGFIAESRELVPKLIAMVRALRAEIDRVAPYLAIHNACGYGFEQPGEVTISPVEAGTWELGSSEHLTEPPK